MIEVCVFEVCVFKEVCVFEVCVFEEVCVFGVCVFEVCGLRSVFSRSEFSRHPCLISYIYCNLFKLQDVIS